MASQAQLQRVRGKMFSYFVEHYRASTFDFLREKFDEIYEGKAQGKAVSLVLDEFREFVRKIGVTTAAISEGVLCDVFAVRRGLGSSLAPLYLRL